jgi:hypothetical protein
MRKATIGKFNFLVRFEIDLPAGKLSTYKTQGLLSASLMVFNKSNVFHASVERVNVLSTDTHRR